MKNEKVLITGCAGFIGMHLAKILLKEGSTVLGVDDLNDYYDVNLKKDRLKQLKKNKNFKSIKADISNYKRLDTIFKNFQPNKVVNLAAQAGVRYSLKNPHIYIKTNIKGFMNILECCRIYKVLGLVYASSSSVYGKNKKLPFSINDKVDNPLSIYAATKKANELMAHSYSHLYGLNSTGLRFFTVYGPWGRPDMAMYIFAKKIIDDEPIPVFNNGSLYRDFTYIDDIVLGLKIALKKNYKYEILNLGNNKAEYLIDVINILELNLNKKAKIEFLKMQPGDVQRTEADIEYSYKKLNFIPRTSIKEGIPKFVNWLIHYKSLK